MLTSNERIPASQKSPKAYRYHATYLWNYFAVSSHHTEHGKNYFELFNISTKSLSSYASDPIQILWVHIVQSSFNIDAVVVIDRLMRPAAGCDVFTLRRATFWYANCWIVSYYRDASIEVKLYANFNIEIQGRQFQLQFGFIQQTWLGLSFLWFRYYIRFHQFVILFGRITFQ